MAGYWQGWKLNFFEHSPSGRVSLKNEPKKNQQFALAQDVLTLTWASGRVLISNLNTGQVLFFFLVCLKTEPKAIKVYKHEKKKNKV